MTDSHSYSFFGKSSGMTLNSSSKEDPYIFLKCIKQKDSGDWEKPTKGEGKTIKLSLEEMVSILQVLEKKVMTWSTYHSYKESGTQISFKWKDDNYQELYINIDDYKKMLKYSQVEIFRLLLTHILNEKIEFATSPKLQEKNPIKSKYYDKNPPTEKEPPKEIKNKIINSNDELTEIFGEITANTEKALNIKFFGGKEIWIPRSTIHNEFKVDSNEDQKFIIDTWVLKKNSVVA